MKTTKGKLNSSEILTKSKHGGKRPGAGRPCGQSSIRTSLKEQAQHAIDYPAQYNQHFTRWDLERDEFIMRHGIFVVRWFCDLPNHSLRDYRKTLLTGYQAYRIAHHSPREQCEILMRDYRHVLIRALEQYEPQYGNIVPKESDGGSVKTLCRLVSECRVLLDQHPQTDSGRKCDD